MQLILASASPRRKELLKECGYQFEVRTSQVQEETHSCNPRTLPAVNAALKADAVSEEIPDSIVIGADTVILCGDEVIGKPANRQEAEDILRKLSGRTHSVITAVAVRCKKNSYRDDFSETTEVTFRSYTDKDIAEYLSLVNVYDKAGAYAIQEHGEILVDRINGNEDTVIGLPCHALVEHLTGAIVQCESAGKKLWALFIEFAKITTMVIGGGYVILAAAEDVFVRRRKWLSPNDFLDMVAISQTVPGIIACNGAIYIGYRVAGLRGSLCAMLGTALPPMIVITAIAAGMEYLPLENPYVSGAFLGVNSCVIGLVAAMAIKMGKKALKSCFEWAISLSVLLAMVIWKLNPGVLMLCTIPLGIAYVMWKKSQLDKGGEKCQ